MERAEAGIFQVLGQSVRIELRCVLSVESFDVQEEPDLMRTQAINELINRSGRVAMVQIVGCLACMYS